MNRCTSNISQVCPPQREKQILLPLWIKWVFCSLIGLNVSEKVWAGCPRPSVLLFLLSAWLASDPRRAVQILKAALIITKKGERCNPLLRVFFLCLCLCLHFFLPAVGELFCTLFLISQRPEFCCYDSSQYNCVHIHLTKRPDINFIRSFNFLSAQISNVFGNQSVHTALNLKRPSDSISGSYKLRLGLFASSQVSIKCWVFSINIHRCSVFYKSIDVLEQQGSHGAVFLIWCCWLFWHRAERLPLTLCLWRPPLVCYDEVWAELPTKVATRSIN